MTSYDIIGVKAAISSQFLALSFQAKLSQWTKEEDHRVPTLTQQSKVISKAATASLWSPLLVPTCTVTVGHYLLNAVMCLGGQETWPQGDHWRFHWYNNEMADMQ